MKWLKNKNFFSPLNYVCPLCLTTVRLWLDMSKFFLAIVQWLTVVCSPAIRSVMFSRFASFWSDCIRNLCPMQITTRTSESLYVERVACNHVKGPPSHATWWYELIFNEGGDQSSGRKYCKLCWDLDWKSANIQHQWFCNVKYIWNSYLYCGCRWKWRVNIAVNFPI